MYYSSKVDEYNKLVGGPPLASYGPKCMSEAAGCIGRRRRIGWPILSRSLRKVGFQNPISPIRFAAMTDAANLDGVGIWANEEDAVVTTAQPKFFSSLKSLNISDARLCETVKY